MVNENSTVVLRYVVPLSYEYGFMDYRRNGDSFLPTCKLAATTTDPQTTDLPILTSDRGKFIAIPIMRNSKFDLISIMNTFSQSQLYEIKLLG